MRLADFMAGNNSHEMLYDSGLAAPGGGHTTPGVGEPVPLPRYLSNRDKITGVVGHFKWLGLL